MSVQARAAHETTSRSFIEEARRRQIVEAAIEVIAELGYPRASFARIAGRAGISPSLISYHFRSKGELNRAIALTIQQDLDGSVSGAASRATSHVDAVRRVIIGFVQYVDRSHDRMLALRQLDIALAPNERADIRVLDERDGVERWVSLLTAGQGADEFRSFDPRSVAVAIMGLLNAVPRELIGNDGADAERLGDELADLVTRGIARDGFPIIHGTGA